MISLDRASYQVQPRYAEYAGLSTDVKPVEVDNGDEFQEINTGFVYKFDETNGEWVKQPTGGGGGAIDDDTISTGTTWSSRMIVDSLAPSFEISGPVVTCNPVPGYPLSVVSQIMPVQEGEGDPSPDNVRPIRGWTESNLLVGGLNLFNKENFKIGIKILYDASFGGQISDNQGHPESVVFRIPIKTNQTYYFHNPQYQTCWLDRIVLCDSIASVGYQNIALYSSPDKNYERYGFTFIDAPADSMLIQFTKVDGTKFTQEDIDALTTTIGLGEIKEDAISDNPASRTITLPFGQTIYGGTLDVVTGMLTVTQAEIASYNGEDLPGGWISDRDIYSPGATPTIGAQVVYELAEPQTIQLTAQEIHALSGVNTIYADTGDTTVSGRADPISVINKLAERIAALESAATNI